MTQIGVYPGGALREIPTSTSAGLPEPAAPGAGLHVDAGVQVGPVTLEVFGSIAAKLGALAGQLEADRADRRRPRLPPESVVPIYIPETPLVLQQSGAWFLDVPQVYRPTLGRYWDVQIVTMRGFTAGTGSALLNGQYTGGTISGDLFAPFPAAGEQTYGKLQKVLRPNGERLTFTASGVTLAAGFTAPVVSVRAVSVLEEYLADYAM